MTIDYDEYKIMRRPITKVYVSSVTVFPGSNSSTSGCVCVYKHIAWKFLCNIIFPWPLMIAPKVCSYFLRMEMQCQHLPSSFISNLKLDVRRFHYS